MKSINKWVPTSTATVKGHLHRTQKNLWSTKADKNKYKENYDKDMHPIEERNTDCEMFCFASLAEEFNNRIYSYATGKFLVLSYHGYHYFMVVYIYHTNAILVRPMENREKETIVENSKKFIIILLRAS